MATRHATYLFLVTVAGIAIGFLAGHWIPETTHSWKRQAIADQQVTSALAFFVAWVYFRRLYMYEPAGSIDRLWTQRGAIVLLIGLGLDKQFWSIATAMFLVKSTYYQFFRVDIGGVTELLASLLMWVGLMMMFFPWTLKTLGRFWWLPYALVPALWSIRFMASGIYLD